MGWTRSEILELLSVIVAILGIVASVASPEIRPLFGLDAPAANAPNDSSPRLEQAKRALEAAQRERRLAEDRLKGVVR